jgi:hypothetical protein
MTGLSASAWSQDRWWVNAALTSWRRCPRRAWRRPGRHPRPAPPGLRGHRGRGHRPVAVQLPDPGAGDRAQRSGRSCARRVDNPVHPHGPVGATHIHGIRDADAARAPRFAQVLLALPYLSRSRLVDCCSEHAPDTRPRRLGGHKTAGSPTIVELLRSERCVDRHEVEGCPPHIGALLFPRNPAAVDGQRNSRHHLRAI